MPAKQRSQKGKGKAPVAEPLNEPETAEVPAQNSDEEETCIYRSDRYAFTSEKENTLVQWFSEHPEFYQKSHRRYADEQYKDKQPETIAAQLSEPAGKIIGWFRNQRTAVGKVYKHKSGQATETLTQRKAWQVKAFAFLKEHISPRSYTVESTVIPCSVRPDSRASNDDSDDCSVNVCDVYSESSSSVVGSKSSALPSKKKRARRVDEALLDYLSRPRPAENITEQLKSLTSPQDERTAFGQWIISRTMKVPDDRWEQFQRAAFDFVMSWTQPSPLAPQSHQQHHVQNYPQPYQQYPQVGSQLYQPQHHSYTHNFTQQFQSRQTQNTNQPFSQSPQMPSLSIQSNPPAVQISFRGNTSVSSLQSSPSLGASQLSEFSIPTGEQTSDNVERSDVQN